MRYAAYFLATVFVGFLAIGLIGSAMNWPDAGAVFAIAVMGCFIIREIRAVKKPESEEKNED